MNQTLAKDIKSDSFKTKDGRKVTVHFIQHASFYLTFDGLTIYADPVKYEGVDYSTLPKADIILITHDHYDHLDKEAVSDIMTPTTVIYGSKYALEVIKTGIVLRNGEKSSFKNIITIEAVPAYNTTEGRESYHPKGRDNGYIITLGGSRIYIPGDCEDMPEMKQFKPIDVAFFPINQPYTMTVEQAINAAKIIKPKILYPIHYSDTDLTGLSVLKKAKIDVRIFKM
ncbi:MAG: MBL fold metallo-hydrolase [Bacteroidetes bacterium]|nr:MBL fold metallo-hydrolase [Bacteroidota bacterium]MCL1969195.1 MBL fold metallo-hydrolase [Bacteroidota bacterium]